MKATLKTLVTLLVLAVATPSQAQLLNRLANKVQNKIEQKAEQKASQSTDKAINKAEKEATDMTKKSSKSERKTSDKEEETMTLNKGTKIYVSASKGSNRNDGKSASSPLKDLQKAIDDAPEGSVIMVAQGNYLGKLDQGWVKINKYLSVIGGYSDDFSKRDPLKYKTTMRPTPEQRMTSGNQGVMDIRVSGKRNGNVVIDGMIFDRGQFNLYVAPVYDNPVASAPKGCESGRIVCVGETPAGVPVLEPKGVLNAYQLLSGEMEGNLTITNCSFLNGYHFAIQMACKGGVFNIYNNIFVSNRMAACEIRGTLPQPNTSMVKFHNNTVFFTWCRDKIMEDMGYGFRYMTGTDAEVYNNIFGCTNYGALDRTYIDGNKEKEAKRKTSAWNNLFFANRNGDIVLPSGGGGWTFVKAANFEDVDQLEKYENNREMNSNEFKAIKSKLDNAYLNGFLSITGKHETMYDENSADNQRREAFGLNKRGIEIVRPTMYGNRYPFEKAFELFGAIKDYGAQNIK